MRWLLDHPLILWPLVSGLISALFKPRTPEEYAALPPRLAALLKFVGALGVDPAKMLEATRQMVTGGNTKP